MKRMICVLLCAVLALSTLSVTAFADGLIDYTVYVTIADENGEIVVPDQPITVGGVADGTGMPIFAALKMVHDRFYEGGAEAGFETKHTEQYGTSLEKLWGVKNGGSYGYYVNDKPAYSLDDILYTGDHLYAWIYQDTVKWSDTYCYFDNNEHINETVAGKAFTGRLLAVEFDENWQPVSVPVKGAMITDNGEDTGVVTDENGCFTVTPDARVHIYSARSDSMTMVTPRMYVMAGYPTVTVTIADGSGQLQAVKSRTDLYDTDNDGKLTISDALYIAHDNLYEGGAEAGYEVKKTEEYGTSLEKLWGVKNGGSYGYYVNNMPAWSLDDELGDGDDVYAWIYQDTKKYSDQYVYFEEPYTELSAGEIYEVKLMTVIFDESWQPVAVPMAGACITIDGEETSSVTDEDGVAAIRFSSPGEYLVSAKSETAFLTPPAMPVTVNPQLGDADMDGYITVLDATTIQKYKASIIGEDRIDLAAADVDSDGYVTVMDATRIQKYKARILELDGTPIVFES